jgi:glutaredoxin-related protein
MFVLELTERLCDARALEQPRCRFSRRIVEALQQNTAPFSTFDILTEG